MSSSLPKVSVLIPTYNYARYLPETIESVLGQDFKDYEIIVSDDASSDDSADIIRRYAAREPRIRAQLNASNLGMVANWNWCLKEARGEHVKFLFGDDCLASPRALGRMAALLDENPGATLAASARFILDENSNVTGLWDDFGRPGLHDGPRVIARCLRKNVNLIGEPSTVMFRRIAGLRGFDPRLRQIVDLEMWFHLLQQGDLAYTTEPLCVFRRHVGQQTVVNSQSRVGDREMVRLLAESLVSMSFRERAGLGPLAYRRILFRSLYYLNKSGSTDPDFMALSALLRKEIPLPWRILCWVLHRVTRPAENLRRAVRLLRLREAAQVATEQRDFLAALRSKRAVPGP